MTNQIMTPAEFAAYRERMQIPVSHLADKWEVRRQSVNRLERGYRAIPDGIQEGMKNLIDDFEGLVETLSDDFEHMPEDEKVIYAEAGDGSLSTDPDMPRATWRAIALDVARRTGAHVEYR